MRRRRTPTVRTRILSVVLAVAALGMAVAGGTSYVVARDQVEDDVYASLEQEATEFRTNAEVAADPASGVPMDTIDQLLTYAIKTTYPDQDEAVLGLIDGTLRKVPGDDDRAWQESLEGDDEFIDVAASVRPGESPGVHRASTAAHGDVAYIAVPLQMEGSDQIGHYVTAIDMTTAYTATNRVFLAYAGIAAVSLLLIGIIGWAVAGRLLAPLRSLRRTAQRISDADLSQRIPADQLARRDEVSDLGRTMNAMLDRLATSFDTQRQVLDDVGHELRTPITVIRGHTELMDPADPADVSEVRAVTLDELDRMQRLVDDLMLLAKSRRPDFVHAVPVEVDDLLATVLEKARSLGERDWRLDGSPGPGVMAVIDRQRITQALLQLMSNALRFTPAGGVIALGARLDRHGEDAPSLQVWVRDEGEGIAPDEREHIFERHVGAGGAGLGLAIVSAICEAHGGRAKVVSIPGQGSTFTLVVPQTEGED